MGAHFDYVTIPACSTEEMRKKFESIQSSYCNENGMNSYAGHIGIARGLTIHSKQFNNSESAEEYVEKYAEKWGAAIAVRVGDFEKVFPYSTADKKLYSSYQEVEKQLANWDADLIKRTKAAKSLQRSCEKCKSKITIQYIKSCACPVCGSDKFLETETDQKKHKALQEKQVTLNKKVVEAKKVFVEKYKNDAHWFIGALCAS